jgi:chromosome segregation ATPase
VNSSKKQTATKADLKALERRQKATFVSKSDFKREVAKLATKEELKREVAKLATKEELKREVAKLATKEELKREVAKLVTKEEFKREIDKLASQGALHATEIQELKQHVARLESTMNTKFDVVLQAIDGLAAKFDEHKTEHTAVQHSLLRHDRRLGDHERRIEKLEVGLQ